METYRLIGMEGGRSQFPSIFYMVQGGHTTPHPSRPTRQIERSVFLDSTGRHMVSAHIERLVLLDSTGRHMIIYLTDEIKLLLDADVEVLCKFVRHPGRQALFAVVLQADPGNQVSLRSETNLKLTCYYLRHRDRTSRATLAADITLENVRHTHDLRTTERNNDNATAVTLLTPSY